MILLTSDELNVSQQSCGGKWKIKNRCQHILVIRAEYTPVSCHRPLCMFCSSSSSPDRLDTVVSCTHSYCTDASGGAYATHNNIKKLYPAWQVYPDIMRCVYALVVL